MNERKEHGPLAAAEEARARVMETIHKQAEAVFEGLQRDVLRLIEETQRSVEVDAPPVPDPLEPAAWPDSEGERQSGRLDAKLRHEITEIVRTEIAALDVAALVKAEIDTQLRAVTKLLQERLKGMTKPGLQKLTPMLSRRRR